MTVPVTIPGFKLSRDKRTFTVTIKADSEMSWHEAIFLAYAHIKDEVDTYDIPITETAQ